MTSILPYEDCCTVFVPKHPVINPTIEASRIEESKFNYEEMIEEAVDSIETIEINDNKDEFSSLL